MQLGIWLPIVHRTPPHVASQWELEGEIEDIAQVAAAAEACGYRYLFAPEHIALPVSKVSTRGEVYWDPVSTLGYLAARTRGIRLVPLVFVAAYHHPLEIAKRCGTLDRISHGRVIIGIGVGSLTEEFELLGANFKERGRRADDSLRALRAASGARIPHYEGAFYRFSDMIVDPGLRADMKFWIGGISAKSVQRAIELGDGWAPTKLPPETIAEILRDPETRRLLAKRDRSFDITYIMSDDPPLDVLNNPAAALKLMKDLQAVGVTVLAPNLVRPTKEAYLAQLEAMADLAAKVNLR